MNETAWQAGEDLPAMLDYLEGKTSDRKLRLFACACVRHRWGHLAFQSPRDAVEMAERLAVGQVPAGDLEQMRTLMEMVAGNSPQFEQPTYQAAAATLAESAVEAARNACEFIRQQAALEAAYEVIPGQDERRVTAEAAAAECRILVGIANEIFGNPFRPVHRDPAWLVRADGAVRQLAEWIDEEQRFEELPYLADALMDAGCGEETLLRHLREPGNHVRGCWGLDLVVGRG